MEEGLNPFMARLTVSFTKNVEMFRRMMMKAFGTMARVYNPAVEVPLKRNWANGGK